MMYLVWSTQACDESVICKNINLLHVISSRIRIAVCTIEVEETGSTNFAAYKLQVRC